MRPAFFILGLALAASMSTTQADPPAPDLALRINGRFGGAEPLQLWQGEPVIAEVVLRNRGPASAAPLVLAPPSGSWAARVTIAAAGGSGAPAPWPLVTVGNPSRTALALQPSAVTTLVLRLDPAASGKLALGSVKLVAQLDLADGTGWQGVVESAPIAVEVVTPPAAPTGEALGQRQLLRVRAALLAGDGAGAETAASDLLQAEPRRPEAFVALALVSEAKGDRALALMNIDLAMARAADLPEEPPAAGAAAPKPKPVPFEYYDLRRRFEDLPEPPPPAPPP